MADNNEQRVRAAEASALHQRALANVANSPEPEGQKFPTGARVRIAADLGQSMQHYESGCDATVDYTYAHAYGGHDVTSYSLTLDGRGSVAWYLEHQLTLIPLPVDVVADLVAACKLAIDNIGDQAVIDEIQKAIDQA